ncbi:NAD-dependent epimerase/dehydratase family protein [Rhodopseudomonas sp. BR0G17]|uniref:NAD-dependent epimerase/dehydratase family protein n=1 Tax=Rhodopseudomonas sp. BR0G17 TaxID=2269368 RepID=UPI0013DF60A1|nr:NAD-dependent epimerase/dehydratase family protein [Rhodopseudomonas sp. BR0G17]NEW96019.1 NAD-dependent epimerase/dehydratase family protein [Rhodopseudomonas sp. BR0G17]
MTRRILVTGGTGFIGSALVRALVRNSDRVRVLDNNSRGALRRLGDVVDAIDFVEADIRDADAVRKAAAGVDCFVHLAYVNGTRYFYEQPELVLDIAIRGMLSVIDACRANDIGDLVLASSSEAYQTPPIIPTPEDVPLVVPNVLNPRYSYGGGKLACELMAINYGRTGFDRVTIFRPHNVYGPDMGHEHVLPQFVERACKLIDATPQGKVDFEIQGDGTQTRAFVHIDDFTDGLMTVIDKGKHLEIYHIGNPEEITIRDLVPKVFRTLGREANVITGPLTEGSTQRRCPDISKLAALGYAPRVTIDAGLPSLVDWYSRHRAGDASEG